MKKVIALLLMTLRTLFSANAQDQQMKDAKVVSLEQIPREFNTKQPSLTEVNLYL